MREVRADDVAAAGPEDFGGTPAGRLRRWAGWLPASPRTRAPAVLAAVLVFLAVESTAVASLGTPLLPTIQTTDHVSLAASQWALTIALLAGAVVTPVLGRLGDGRLRRAAILGAVAAMMAGCVASALPAGFAIFLAGRALQGTGFGLVPLATAVARDHLPTARRGRAIALIGVTTAAGIGIGYPLTGLLAQYLGLGAPFWFVAALSALALAAAATVLPASPARPSSVDVPGAVLLGLGVGGLILVLAEGPQWGWGSAAAVGCAIASMAGLAGWAYRELRARRPLIELRLLRNRPVLAANLTAFLVAVGFYPLGPLVVRYVQTPPGAGYGFGASVLEAGLMLTPFSLASFAASKTVALAARRVSGELIVAVGCLALITSMGVFLLSRGDYWQIMIAMVADGFGVGCVYAVNPLQITSGVPAQETGSAMSFYQLNRTVAYSIGSALSATLLVMSVPRGQLFPSDAGYSTAALACAAILAVALAVSLLFARPNPPHGQPLPSERS
jgi:predicted MFS family arabinose efflux permease